MKKIMKQIILAMVFFMFTACLPNHEEEGNTGVKAEIAMVADGGSIDDQGFNQGTWEGIKEYGEKNNISHKYYQPVDRTVDDFVAAIDLAVRGGAKVVITPGFRFIEPIYIAQKAYPDVKFIILDGKPANHEGKIEILDNTVSVEYAEEESGFLAGYATVKEGNTKLGFIGGVAVPAVIRYGYGFIQGAEEAAKELNKKDVEMNYYYTGTFDAKPETQTLAATWFRNGTEIIFAAGSGVGQSVMAAAEGANPIGKTIGVDNDWSKESDTVITSAVKAINKSVYQVLEMMYNNEFPGGKSIMMSAKNSGVELPMENSRFKVFNDQQYQEIYSRLASGEFKLKTNLDKDGKGIDVDKISDGTIKVIKVK